MLGYDPFPANFKTIERFIRWAYARHFKLHISIYTLCDNSHETTEALMELYLLASKHKVEALRIEVGVALRKHLEVN